MMGEMQKRGLLYELKGGYRIDMTEEEYREKREELGRIAARLRVNLDVLDLLELKIGIAKQGDLFVLELQAR